MKRFIVSLLLLLVATSLAVAQPFTRRSSQTQHDGLKQYYEIPNFRLGGKYDLADPSKWEIRRRGRHDAGIARRRQAAHRLHRGRHAAPQRGRRNHQCGGHQFLLFRRLHRYVRAVGQGYRAVRRRSHHRPGPPDRYRPLLCRHGRSARAPGAPASRPTGSASSSRNTATTTWCRPTTACCATI